MSLIPRPLAALALCGLLLNCGTLNTSQTVPLGGGDNTDLVSPGGVGDDSLFIGLAFSGGGHRASAFSYGLLQELLRSPSPGDDPAGLAAEVEFIAAVSGGAVTATWFGLNGPEALDQFRARYLLEDGERYMASDPFDADIIARGLSTGINARDTFGRWLDQGLFRGATFADLQRSRVQIAITASDNAGAAPFVFGPDIFDVLCADLARLPLSEAVAASAALPVIFSPIVIAAKPAGCTTGAPAWINALPPGAADDPAMRTYAQTLRRYADPGFNQPVTLSDGGMTDAFGVTGFIAARARSGTAHGPLSAEQAVRMRHMLFLVVDSSIERRNPLIDRLAPGGRLLGLSVFGMGLRLDNDRNDLELAQAYETIGATTARGFSSYQAALTDWHRDVIAYRCGLAPEQVIALRGTAADWDCRDLQLFVGEVSFANLPPDLRTYMNNVPTRLNLPAEAIDASVQAGRIATRSTPAFVAFIRAIAAGN